MVNQRLFPYLAGFKQRATGPQTIEYKIGEVFSEIKNKVQSGYNLRDVIDRVDELRFRSQAEKHELSHLYEAKIKNMGNAGRNGGEYYTPRPLTHEVVGTDFVPDVKKVGNQVLPLWLANSLQPSIAFSFRTVQHPVGRVVLLEIPAATGAPVAFNGVQYVRIGSATPKLTEYPDRYQQLIERL